jgi:redox-regulated HSP33 family molecular chaperone
MNRKEKGKMGYPITFQCDCSEDKFFIKRFLDGTIEIICSSCEEHFNLTQVLEELQKD